MGGFKETPRQKMIGMMYLVLTAMLALNVSKTILDAFKIVNESLVVTTKNFASKVDLQYDEFERQFAQNQDKVAPYWDKAQEVRSSSVDFISYLDSVKFELIRKAEKIEVGGKNGITYDSLKKYSLRNGIKAIDDYTTPTEYMIGQPPLAKGEGYKLKGRIDEYREYLLSFLPEDRRSSFNIGLITEGEFVDAHGKSTNSWVTYNFDQTILAADITIFNKIAAEVKNAEFDIVNYLAQDISARDFKFSKIEAKVVAPSAFVFQGDDYKAEIFVAAVDEKNNPRVEYKMGATEWHDDFISGARVIEGDSGIVHMSLATRSLSPKEYTFAGRIIIKDPTGEEQYYPFTNTFTVAEPSANIAATKMNVFYRGVDNPIRISAAGIPDHRIAYEASVGSFGKTDEGVVINGFGRNTISVNDVTITVFALDENRSRTKLGEQVFRLKDLPNPLVLVRGMTEDGGISKGQMLANPYVLCQMPEYVNFEYNYVVNSFSMTAYKSNGESYDLHATGSQLSAEMERYVQGARRGADVVFKNIKVRGPIGEIKVSPQVLTLK
jgi:gliding motility-associated protein GldM